jgi:hypothetical protein
MHKDKDINYHTCPVCGYSELNEPAYDPETGAPSFDICPSCGCEFGYDDATPLVASDYRKNWIHRGAHWFKPELKPNGWSLRAQLEKIGKNLDEVAD